MYTLGIDLGSSSVKTAIIDNSTGECLYSSQFPKDEMPIMAGQSSWAEQEPELWWDTLCLCLAEIRACNPVYLRQLSNIGIAYQMHGLVMVDKEQNVLRPAIIWCDSRAVDIGTEAYETLGPDYCLNRLLNSPGNFTASKLRWVQENEPETYSRIDKIMLPGDYLAMKLSGHISTTITGLSEGIMWDYQEKDLAVNLIEHFQIDPSLVPESSESFSVHSSIDPLIAFELGVNPGALISYKAGDQPNNALSLNVLEPGEIAATAGTSGVVYGVVGHPFIDEEQRVNSFAHVNYTAEKERIGVLLCINGVGISNAWVKKQFQFDSYEEINKCTKAIPIGSEGLYFFPFGNGAERMLGNLNIEASIEGINYKLHTRQHFARSVQEGVAFAFAYGMEAFAEKNINITKIKAGHANMFLSDTFAQALSDLSNVEIELYNTDGSIGAARGALIGAEILNPDQAFSSLKVVKTFKPQEPKKYQEHYKNWKNILTKKIHKNY